MWQAGDHLGLCLTPSPDRNPSGQGRVCRFSGSSMLSSTGPGFGKCLLDEIVPFSNSSASTETQLQFNFSRTLRGPSGHPLHPELLWKVSSSKTGQGLPQVGVPASLSTVPGTQPLRVVSVQTPLEYHQLHKPSLSPCRFSRLPKTSAALYWFRALWIEISCPPPNQTELSLAPQCPAKGLL